MYNVSLWNTHRANDTIAFPLFGLRNNIWNHNKETCMNDYIIATASTCDLDADGNVFEDDCRRATRDKIYRALRDGKMPNTSQITTYSYYEFFKSLLSQGKPVVFVDMDKAISSSYFNSERAAEQIREEMPGAPALYIMDTRCITTGLGLLLKKMVAMHENGSDIEEVIAWAETNKLNIAHRFLIDDLSWLRKGGRLSNASSFIGSILSIKPLIYVDGDGCLVAWDKCRGKKKAMRHLLERAALEIEEYNVDEIILSHSDCLEDGRKWLDMIQERFPGAKVSLQELGPTIACHVGPGFLSIVYIAGLRCA